MRGSYEVVESVPCHFQAYGLQAPVSTINNYTNENIKIVRITATVTVTATPTANKVSKQNRACRICIVSIVGWEG